MREAYVKIYRKEGILGFWTGFHANLLRNAVINSCELAA
jgi:solute carrier family 25 uncoupling protein 8/9